MLLKKDIIEFRRICEQKLEHLCTDAEAEEMAGRVIRYLRVLKPLDPPQLSAQEQVAFEFIKKTIEVEGRSPSIREITTSLGLTSSRSGH